MEQLVQPVQPEHKAEEKNEAENIAHTEKKTRTREKNLIALLILVIGIAAGSFFVDIVQFVRGEGFSQKALKSSGIVAFEGKTWVAYDDPQLDVMVFTDDACATCVTDDVIVWLRRVAPTIAATKVDVSTEEGMRQAEKYGIVSIPSFVFSQEAEQTNFFRQAGILFEKRDDRYVLKTAQLGIPVGQYIEIPPADDAITIGKADAPVTIVEFSDFQCPFCRTLHPIVEQALEQFKDDVRYVYKNFPLPEHQKAEAAALAAECAGEQARFLDYANILFSRQDDWSKQPERERFLSYARELRINTDQFAQCMDGKKYQSRIDAHRAEAERYGFLGTPVLFVNNQFFNGIITFEQLKKAIDDERAQ